MAAETKQTIQTGNTVLLMIGNHVIGRAQSLQASRDFGTTGAYEIGDLAPAEHVYLQFDGSITLERLRMKKESLDKLGFGALGTDIIHKDVIDIRVIDKYSKEVLVIYHGCSAESISEEFSANSMVSETSTWKFLNSSSGDTK